MQMDGEDGGEEVATDDFAAFEAKAGGEGGDDNAELNSDAQEPEEKGDEEGESGEGEEDPNVNDEGDDSEEKPKRKKASERIAEKTRQIKELERRYEQERKGWEARIERLEKGLPAEKSDDIPDGVGEAPDPTDQKKYPLGALDDRYIEDKLEWLSDRKVAEKLGSVLQREQERDQQAEAERLLTDLRTKADDLAAKGSEIHDDYEVVVVEAGLKGDYPLTQTTFEAATEAENGPQILYGLATDPKEAERVAALSPFKQIQYVLAKDAELKGSAPVPKLPKAPSPPGTPLKGAGNRTSISADTPNFAEFERLANTKN